MKSQDRAVIMVTVTTGWITEDSWFYSRHEQEIFLVIPLYIYIYLWFI